MSTPENVGVMTPEEEAEYRIVDGQRAGVASLRAAGEPSAEDAAALYRASMTETKGGFTEAIHHFARALLSRYGRPAGDAKPVAWFIDWPAEPELGHYLAESPTSSGRCRPLVFADASSRESTPIPEDPVYAYRRKGLDGFMTCDRDRFDELSANPRLFETRIFYAAPVAAQNADDARDAERWRWLRDLVCCSLTLSRNDDHACNYMTAEEWIRDFPEHFADDDPAEVERMMATNTIWRLQIYPNTPVGFNVWHGATPEAAIDAAIAQQRQGEAQ